MRPQPCDRHPAAYSRGLWVHLPTHLELALCQHCNMQYGPDLIAASMLYLPPIDSSTDTRPHRQDAGNVDLMSSG